MVEIVVPDECTNSEVRAERLQEQIGGIRDRLGKLAANVEASRNEMDRIEEEVRLAIREGWTAAR
ncbi:hypothetical protein HYW67_04455 [Candidatus Parcubacteria bacterium]|nr:hypothetical protein [Candidatus Parcubacteria bacterium]